MSTWIKGGVPTDVNIEGINLAPGDGETLTYSLSGRGGAMKMDGNENPYSSSNPQLGGFELGFVVSDDEMIDIRNIQNSQQKLTGYFTTASGITFNFFGGIDSEESLSNEDGIVTIPFKGKVEQQ